MAIATVVIVATLLLPVGSYGAPHASAAPPPAVAMVHASRRRVPVVSQTFTSTIEVSTSYKSTGLEVELLPNSTYAVALFDAATNTSRIVQSGVSAFSTSFGAPVAAGGAFFLSVLNVSTHVTSWEKITLSGQVSYPDLPLSATVGWTLVYGSSSSLYAAAGNLLVKVNPHSLRLDANYSSDIPSGIGVSAILPAGRLLYIAGSSLNSGSGSPFFGYINTHSGRLTTVYSPRTVYSNGAGALFVTLASTRGHIFVGGGLETVINSPSPVISSDAGLLFEYSEHSGSFQNLSSLLPVASWGVWGIVPWGNTVAISLSGYTESDFVNVLAGGIYTVGHGPSLVNQTSLFPTGYVADIYEVTSSSQGWFFSGGLNSITGTGEAVAVHIPSLH